MQFVWIVLLGLAAAVCYGVVHDQVTARLCIEYFTIGHPRIIQTDSITALALFWGVVATWWVGLPLGVLLALAARMGKQPKLEATDVIRPVACLLLVMFVCAGLAGAMGYFLAAQGSVRLVEPMASRVPADRHITFLVDLFMHNASYWCGAIGGIVLGISTWRRRKRMVVSG